MTVYQILKTTDQKTLKALIKSGYISMNIHRDIQIYEKITAYLTTIKCSVEDACIKTMDDIGGKPLDRQLRNIYNKLNYEI